MSFQIGSINKKFNAETDSFRRSFKLTHKDDPIFHKEFDGSSTTDVLVGGDTFVIDNHFFVTGEQLQYTSDATPIAIDSSSPGVGGGTTLPQTVFAVKTAENKFQVAATKALALTGDIINLTAVGSGTTHSFTARKQNTKCIIALDNIIQSPVYERVGAGTTLDQILNRVISLHDVGTFRPYDLLKIDDEIMRIQVIGYNGNANDVFVDRAWLGTEQDTHSVGADVKFLQGDYNIIDDTITFVDTPFGGIREDLRFSDSEVNVATDSFTGISDFLQTGSQVKLRSINPPAPLQGNRDYYIIKNAVNNFSFADTKDDALTGVGITLTTAGIGTHRVVFVDTANGSSFQGRSFIRSDYTGNIIIDDVAQNFTGIAKTFTIRENGSDITGITTDNGAILINNIFQKPEIDYNFIGGSATGITSVAFTGNATNTVSLTDVNANKLPRKGQIVSVASTQGYGYQPRQTGIGTAVVSGFGTITVAMGFTGSGYRNPPTTYRVFVDGGNPTTGAAGTFTVEGGFVKDIFMNTVGAGYTWTNVPRLTLDEPVGYDDFQLISGSTGVGASVSVVVGAGLSIESFTLNNVGYGFTIGEQLSIAGIPTNTGIGTTFRNAIWTVTDTQDDEFAGWVFGKLQILDDFSSEFDGRKTVFTIKENNVPLSIQGGSSTPIDVEFNLLVFLNDALQEPNTSYVFDGGTQIEFTEPPVAGTSMQILLYRGTDSDVSTEGSLNTVKIGDTLKIMKDRKQITPITQLNRVVTALTSRDTLRTNVYTKDGISNQTSPLRPVVWCKQQDDKFIEGRVVNKSRPEYAAAVRPSARLIQSVGTTDNTYYTGGGSLIFSKTEAPDTTSFAIQIVDEDKNNTGFGTTTFINPVETVSGVSVAGDEGIITGIGTTAGGIQFNFHIPLDSQLRVNEFGGILKTGIATGDYFLVTRSNIGSGVTALSQDRTVAIGSCSDFIDTVFQVGHIEDITPVGTASSMRIHVNVETGHGLNFTGLGSGVGNYYGNFSWARFSSGSRTGLAFTCNTSDGLTGLSTAPTIFRSTNLSLDYS